MNVQTNPKDAASNALAVTDAANDAALIKTLGDSLYPGAKPESIAMVLSYCRSAKLDPMLKTVHLVPMSVKVGNNYVFRDVVMPGIAHYRVQASRSGAYLGKTEAEFGPDVEMKWGNITLTVPKWCKVTVMRAVGAHVAEFTATELWAENFATAGRDKPWPNAMWHKRPYAQLAKCTEAQALRMAFPELLGGTHTVEEMEGKEHMRDVTPADDTPMPKSAVKQAKEAKAKGQLDGFAGTKKKPEPEADTVDPDTGEVLTGEVMDEETAEMPAMGDDAKTALAEGRWGHAWKWFQATLPTIAPEHRQLFVNLNKATVAFAAKGTPGIREALAALLAANEVTFNVD
jgi:phage recombination protein Bet